MTKQEVNFNMNQISFRSICISGVASFLIAMALLSHGSAIDVAGVSMFMLFYFVIGKAMISIAMEKDCNLTIEERILGPEPGKNNENGNIYELKPIVKKRFYLLFISVLALNLLSIYVSGGPILLALINLVIVSAFMLIIGAVLAVSIKCFSRMGRVDPTNAVYIVFVFFAAVGGGLFYMILFSEHFDVALKILPVFAVSAGIFTAFELVILNGLHKISIWKNVSGLFTHFMFPAGIMFALVLNYELTNNLDSVSWEFWLENYTNVAKIYLSYLAPGLLIGSLSAFTIKKIRRD